MNDYDKAELEKLLEQKNVERFNQFVSNMNMECLVRALYLEWLYHTDNTEMVVDIGYNKRGYTLNNVNLLKHTTLNTLIRSLI